MTISTREAINRGHNLLMVGFLAANAVGLIGMLFLEDEWIDRAEDMTVIGLAIAAVIWYRTKSHRFQYSFAPYGLLVAALAAKFAALAIEAGDLRALGDELLLVPPLIVMVIVSGYLLYRTRQTESLPDAGLAASQSKGWLR